MSALSDEDFANIIGALIDLRAAVLQLAKETAPEGQVPGVLEDSRVRIHKLLVALETRIKP